MPFMVNSFYIKIIQEHIKMKDQFNQPQNYEQLKTLLESLPTSEARKKRQEDFNKKMQLLLKKINELIFESAAEDAMELLMTYGATIDGLCGLYGDVANCKGLDKDTRIGLADLISKGFMIVRKSLNEAEQNNNRNLV